LDNSSSSSIHRWLYVPRGCAILHVPKRNQDLIQSSIPTSHGYVPVIRQGKPRINNPLPPSDKSRFVQLFEFVGTMDYAPYLCVPAALKFRREVCGGEEAIMDYSCRVAREGAQRIAQILGTETMEHDQPCPMVNVRLPIDPPRPRYGSEDDADVQKRISEVNAFIGKMTVREYNAFVPTIFHNGHFLARLSGQIYLTVDDFERVGRQLREICNRLREGESISSRL
jgi:selenocysteine lyase/cysteine desulfurase